MKLVEQKTKYDCGPCVLAMLADCDLDKVPADVVEGNRSPVVNMGLGACELGFKLTDRGDLAGQLPTSAGAILITVHTKSDKIMKHWIATDGKQVFDPKFGVRDTLRRVDDEQVLSAIFYESNRVVS